jgi:hypothetical protein
MRPALQKLLKRPSSLEFLRYLVGSPPPSFYTQNLFMRPRRSRHLSTAPAIREVKAIHSGHDNVEKDLIDTNTSLVQNRQTQGLHKKLKLLYTPWEESEWTKEQIEFESDLEAVSGTRLVDHSHHRTDLNLWACLLDYRTRRYGPEAVRTYWAAVLDGRLELPVAGQFATKFWSTFLNLGFQDEKVLLQICNYADQQLSATGKRWPALYRTIIQRMLLSGKGKEANKWHERLYEKHPPSAASFLDLCRLISHMGADMESLVYIYQKNNFRNVYSKIIPTLCKREEFLLAFKWHFFLLKHGDFPRTLKDVEPLIHFMAIYYVGKAKQITQSLVKAGVPFSSTLSVTEENTSKISREVMNLLHGDVLQIPQTEYNDGLGARWFATRWVSLDLAMSAIHALGIQQIGPLSLQAIALRDPTAESVTRRLNQLQDLGIFIGSSKYSKAIEKFARAENQEFLDGLLKSDQHPDALEDVALQEELLVSYARLQDWSQYRRTLAIRLIGSRSHVESENIILRSHLDIGDTSYVLASLRKMQVSGLPVMSNTISRILSRVLRQRRLGHRPVSSPIRGRKDDLSLAITILRSLMEAGSFVPTTSWREIIKRLGMLGRIEELSELCIFLASWYGPANQDAIINPVTQPRLHRYEIPKIVPTSHPLHPLRILFGNKFQMAVVEWGIMYGLRAQKLRPRSVRHQRPAMPQITAGIDLLTKLHNYGVHIKRRQIWRAVVNRMIIYYGPGRSNRLRNRADRARNSLSLPQMARQIDEAVGHRLLSKPGLPGLVASLGLRGLRRRTRRQTTLRTTRDPVMEHISSLPHQSRTNRYLL